MIREYYPQYRNHKIAVVSPCIAKRREFDETGLGNCPADHKDLLFDFLERITRRWSGSASLDALK